MCCRLRVRIAAVTAPRAAPAVREIPLSPVRYQAASKDEWDTPPWPAIRPLRRVIRVSSGLTRRHTSRDPRDRWPLPFVAARDAVGVAIEPVARVTALQAVGLQSAAEGFHRPRRLPRIVATPARVRELE